MTDWISVKATHGNEVKNGLVNNVASFVKTLKKRSSCVNKPTLCKDTKIFVYTVTLFMIEK